MLFQCSDGYRVYQPGIGRQQQKAPFFAHPHTQTVSMLEQIAIQHQAKYELELLRVYSTNSSLHFDDCAIIQWPIPPFMEAGAH